MVIGIQTLGISQSSYPRKILWENDTVLAITKMQLVTINRTINDYLFQVEKNHLLTKEIEGLDSTCVLLRDIISKQDSINQIESTKFDRLSALNEQLRKDMKKQKLKTIKTATGVGVGGVIIGILIGLLIN